MPPDFSWNQNETQQLQHFYNTLHHFQEHYKCHSAPFKLFTNYQVFLIRSSRTFSESRGCLYPRAQNGWRLSTRCSFCAVDSFLGLFINPSKDLCGAPTQSSSYTSWFTPKRRSNYSTPRDISAFLRSRYSSTGPTYILARFVAAWHSFNPLCWEQHSA